MVAMDVALTPTPPRLPLLHVLAAQEHARSGCGRVFEEEAPRHPPLSRLGAWGPAVSLLPFSTCLAKRKISRVRGKAYPTPC